MIGRARFCGGCELPWLDFGTPAVWCPFCGLFQRFSGGNRTVGPVDLGVHREAPASSGSTGGATPRGQAPDA